MTILNKNPLISILLPTRKRVVWLNNVLSYFVNNTCDQRNIEFIFRIDDDDDDTLNFLDNMKSALKMQVICGPRGRGYLDMHLWVNEMCKVAIGDWIFVANDDSVLISYGWDQTLLRFQYFTTWHGIKEISVLGTYVDKAPSEAFLFVRKEVVNILGHYSRHHLCDNYMWKVAKICESAHYVPIHFYHAPRSITRDETGLQVMATYGDEELHKKVVSPQMAKWRLEDAEKLINYMMEKQNLI